MLKPVHSQTEPKINANKAVSGYAVHDFGVIPKMLRTAGIIPASLSNVNRKITPPTIIGMTMPRKIDDFIIALPFTFLRMTAKIRPRKVVNGRWISIQMKL